jgi:hypothetical protein
MKDDIYYLREVIVEDPFDALAQEICAVHEGFWQK